MGSFRTGGAAILSPPRAGPAGEEARGEKISVMMRFLTIVSALVVAWAATPQPALAVGEDVFVVPRVAVQARADSATQAKAAAQRDGRRRAIDILLRRLTVEDDWPRLPTLTGAPSADAATATASPGVAESYDSFPQPQGISLSNEMLEQLESGFEVYNEKSSSKTYRAYITYRFKPDQVRKLLKDAQIPYSEAQTRTALVVPVLQTGNGLYLWEENNPWMAAWKVRPYNNELTPLIAPLGDLEDSANVSARQAVAIDSEALGAMAARYSVPQIIVAHAFLQQRDGDDRLRVRFINAYVDGGFVGSVDAGDLGIADDLAGVGEPQNNQLGQPAVGDVIAEAWFSQPSGNFPTLAERAIEETIAKYAKPWKERTLIDHTVAALLNVSAIYNSIGEWAQIRTALTATPLVSGVQVRSLSRGGAEMVIQAFGDPEKLVVAMEAQGLVLWSYDGEYWTIATPAAAQQWQAVERRGGIFGRNNIDDGSPVRPVSYPSAREF